MKPFDPTSTFTTLGVALRNLLVYFPELEPQRVPFVPQDFDGVNEELKKVGVGIFYQGSKFDVGDGLQRPADPHIGVAKVFEGEVERMSRVQALVAFARAMVTLCEATVTQGIPQDDYHLRLWEAGEHNGWAQSGCYFFDFPDTTPEEREEIAQQMGVHVVAFHFGKMFVFSKDEEAKISHHNTLFILNWSGNRYRKDREAEPIFLWTQQQMNEEGVITFLSGLKQPPCWFHNGSWVHKELGLGFAHTIS